MRNIGVTGTAKLVAVALRGYFVSAPHEPGILGRPVGAQFFEKLFEAGIELPLGAVAIEIQRDIGRRRHTQVYQSALLKRFTTFWGRSRRAHPQVLRKAKGERRTKKSPGAWAPGLSGIRITDAHQDAGGGCSARFCLISFTLSRRSSAILV